MRKDKLAHETAVLNKIERGLVSILEWRWIA